MTWRIRDRATFETLGRHGRRGRRGPITVTWLDDGADHARVAYAVGRRAGGAVVRNRVRRRLRAHVSARPDLGPGAYLVSAGPEAAALGFDELGAALDGALAKAVGTDTRHDSSTAAPGR